MYQTKQQSLKETMNIVELGKMEILENAADIEEPSLDSLDAVANEEPPIVVENLESDERDGDDMAAPVLRDTIKPSMMMLSARFLKRWRVIRF